jgi:hypothetical protein
MNQHRGSYSSLLHSEIAVRLLAAFRIFFALALLVGLWEWATATSSDPQYVLFLSLAVGAATCASILFGRLVGLFAAVLYVLFGWYMILPIEMSLEFADQSSLYCLAIGSIAAATMPGICGWSLVTK